ncbi:SRPBCC family protein [Flexivirga alba]|uniref:SRPBCC family protein n=1 Tax=Flexivirga alba TaxID=702742 RepID=A0ABW2ADS9_9MICO
MSRLFRFASSHDIAAPRDAVFEVLRDAERWPQWWPQIRSVTPYDDTHGRAEIRSVLPLTLRVELSTELVDAESGVLRATLAGDLVGWSQFALRASGPDRTILDYTQEVRLGMPGMIGRLASSAIARPVLIANHAAMMRSGMRGLARAALNL